MVRAVSYTHLDVYKRHVNLLFVLLVPEQATEEHLQILSEIAERFSDPAFREKLCVAPDAATVLALFNN